MRSDVVNAKLPAYGHVEGDTSSPVLSGHTVRMFQQCLRLRGATSIVLLNPFRKHIQERGTSSGQENRGHILLSDPCDGLCGFLGSSRTGQSETGISGAGLEQTGGNMD